VISQFFNLQLRYGQKDVILSVYNVCGGMIMRITSNQSVIPFNMNNSPAGIYLVEITGRNEKTVFKINKTGLK
jgi:type IX secretion system substrate protein